MSDIIERLRSVAVHGNVLATLAADALEAKDKEIERLEAIVDAAKADLESAKFNCGKYPESQRDCSDWIERGMRCSDCPVEVWLSCTHAALNGEQKDE